LKVVNLISEEGEVAKKNKAFHYHVIPLLRHTEELDNLFSRINGQIGQDCHNSRELRLEEAEGNSPGQRPVVIIVSPICAAP